MRKLGGRLNRGINCKRRPGEMEGEQSGGSHEAQQRVTARQYRKEEKSQYSEGHSGGHHSQTDGWRQMWDPPADKVLASRGSPACSRSELVLLSVLQKGLELDFGFELRLVLIQHQQSYGYFCPFRPGYTNGRQLNSQLKAGFYWNWKNKSIVLVSQVKPSSTITRIRRNFVFN